MATSSTPSSGGGGGVALPSDQLKPLIKLHDGRVMTDQQFETLRRQISVYSTICSQLIEMHKALMAQQALCMPPNNMMLAGQQIPYDPVMAGRSSGRQRWMPSQIQLQILENVFESSQYGTPSKQKIKELTGELGQHGFISETNVYNWFQNRKARAKRKQHQKEGESEVEVEEVMDVQRKDKRAALQMFQEDDGGCRQGFTQHVSQGDVHAGSSFNENLMQKSQREFSTMMVLINGKPWEVPSTVLDLKGSFGERSVLLDVSREAVPTDERGFTTRPLHAGKNYTLIQY